MKSPGRTRTFKWDRPAAEVRSRGGSPPNGDFLDTLTDQERRILRLVAEGLTNREIAERVHLAEKTVRNYLSNVLTKLGMRNRTQVAVYVALCVQREHARRPPGPRHS